MKAVFSFSASVAAVIAASPAYADIEMVDASSIQGANVLFNVGTQTGTTVNGFTNSNPSAQVNFTSGGAILRAKGGQARIEGDLNGGTPQPNDTINLTELQFELDSGGTFNNLEFRLFGGNATTASFSLTDDLGTVFTFNDVAISPSGFFGFRAINGQSIASVSFTVNGDGIQDVRQIRLDALGTVAVPEPATWAMMLGGFGLLGAAARRRSRTTVTYA
jgi:hypothetical protein